MAPEAKEVPRCLQDGGRADDWIQEEQVGGWNRCVMDRGMDGWMDRRTRGEWRMDVQMRVTPVPTDHTKGTPHGS